MNETSNKVEMHPTNDIGGSCLPEIPGIQTRVIISLPNNCTDIGVLNLYVTFLLDFFISTRYLGYKIDKIHKAALLRFRRK